MMLSLSLPFMFFGLFGAMIALFIRRASLDPATVERIRQKNPESPYEKHDPSRSTGGRKNRSWESEFDSEVQRLRRKSLGMD